MIRKYRCSLKYHGILIFIPMHRIKDVIPANDICVQPLSVNVSWTNLLNSKTKF